MTPAQPPDWLASPEATLDDAQIVLDGRGRIVSLNEEAQMLAGRREPDCWGEPFEEIFPVRDEFSGGAPTPETRAVVLPTPRGELRAFDLMVVPRVDEPGWTIVLRPIISSGDIEHESWANLAKGSKEGTGLGDPNTNTIGLVSESFARLHGYTPGEMLGLPLSVLFPDDGGGVADFEQNLREGRVSWESRHRRKDGTLFDALVSATTIRDPLGQERFRAIRVEDITDRKAAEEREQAQRRLVDRVIGLVPSIVYLIHPTEGNMRFLSRGVASALGYHSEAGPLPGVEASDARFTSESLHPEDRPAMLDHRRRLATLADGELATFEYRVRDAEGRYRWFLSRDTVFERDDAGRVRTILGAATDVTELKATAEELRETEQLRDVAAAGMAAWWWDLETGVARVWNDEGRIYGYPSPGSPGEEVRTTVEDVIERFDPRDRPRIESALHRAMAEGQDFEEEVRVIGSGETRWVLAKGLRVSNADGRPSILAGVSIDITARKRAEAALHETELEMRRLVESATDYAIYTTDLERRVVSWNTGAARIFGYAEDEIMGQSGDILFTPEDRKAREPEMEAETALATGRASDDRWHLRKDGSRFFASGVATPLAGPDGEPYGFVKIARDLTEKRRAEQDLQESEQLTRRLIESATEYAIFTTDLDRKIDFWNPGAARIFGYTEEEILGQPGDILFTPEDRAAGQPDEENREALAAGRASDDRWHLRKDGSRFFASGVSTPLTDDEGKPYGFVKIARDLTERRLLTQELHQSDARFRALFGSIDEGYALVELLRDERGNGYDYRYLEINGIAERQSGVTGHVGRTARELYPGLDEEWIRIYSGVADSGEPLRFEKAFGDRLYTIFITRVGGAGSPLLATISADITDRRRDEAALRQNEARQTYLLRLSDALRPLSDPVEIQREATRLLGEHIGVNRAYYYRIAEEEGAIYVDQEYRNGASLSLVGTHPLSSYAWALPIFHRGEPLVYAEAGSSPLIPEAHRSALEALSISAAASVPLLKGGRLVGALAVTSNEPREWTELELNLLDETAERIWAAIERAHAEANLAESRVRLEADLAAMRRLNELHIRFASDPDLDAALGEILDVAIEIVGFERATIQLLNESGDALTMVAHRGYREDSPFIAHFRFEGSQVACDSVRGSRARLIIEDIATFEPLQGTVDREVALADNIHSTQSTPMISPSGQVVGVLSTQRPQPYRPSEHQLHLIDLLAWAGAEFVERRRNDAALRASREAIERQARLIDTTLATLPDHVFALDRKGRYLYANAALLDYWGRSLPEIVGKTPRELGHPDDLALQLEEALHRALEAKAPVTVPLYNPSRTEREKVYESLFAPFLREDGTVELVVGWSRDVTGTLLDANALRESEAMLRVGLGAAGGAVAFTNLDTHEVRFGGDVTSVYGLPPGTVSAPWDEMVDRVPPDEMARFSEAFAESARTGETFTFEHHYHRFDGRLGRIRAIGKVIPLDPARPEAKTLIGVNFPVPLDPDES